MAKSKEVMDSRDSIHSWIRIYRSTKMELEALGKKGESYADLIARILDEYKKVMLDIQNEI